MPFTICNTDATFEREPLIRPFGFKGVHQKEFWVAAALLESDKGNHSVGTMTQCVAWSDLDVFLNHTESGGNALLYLSLEYALKMVEGRTFSDPIAMQEAILESVNEYGKRICETRNLRMTFVLSSMVALDNAAWMLYALDNNISTFDEMIPEPYRAALSYHHKHIAHIPLFSYNVPLTEIKEAVQDGYFFMKIKIGSPGTQKHMLANDIARIESIHKLIGHLETPYTENNKIPYYFDANGRYENKETLQRLLEHADKIGMLEQIAIVEEPFPEHLDINVSDVGVRIAADESAHTAQDVETRIEMGYGAIALKAAAKTLSMTLKMSNTAHIHGIPCFLADLTCTPILVDWNKNIAARLAPFPGLKNMGLLESNGHQNYVRWKDLTSYHTCANGSWLHSHNGIFELNHEFYAQSGGILQSSPHYLQLFGKNHKQ